MSYEMSVLRKEDLSLYLYIKDTVLKNFQETVELAPLNIINNLCSSNSFVYECASDIAPSPTGRGRGWVYFDTSNSTSSCEPYVSVSGTNGDGDIAYGTPEQSNKVTLYETTASGLQVVDWKEYMIDYSDGRIIINRELLEPKVTYTWNYVSVVDEWAAVEADDTPVIVIDVNSTNKSGYQLGGGKKSERRVDIHLFASNPAERNDISEVIYDGLYNKSCPLYNFNSGSVIDYDGTFYGRKHLMDREPNPIDKTSYLFDRGLVEGINKLYFDSVNSRNVSLPVVMSTSREGVMLSDLNSYRARINFNMYSYDNRNLYSTNNTEQTPPVDPPLPPQTQLIMQAIPDIDNSTIAIVIGINGDGQVNINWGDGNTTSHSGQMIIPEHTYTAADTYDITIDGDLSNVDIIGLQNQPYIQFDWDISLLENIKLITIYDCPNAILDLSTISGYTTLIGLMFSGQHSIIGELFDIPSSIYMLQATNTLLSGQLSDLLSHQFESTGWIESIFGMPGPLISINGAQITGDISSIYNGNLVSTALSNLDLIYTTGIVPNEFANGDRVFTNCGLDRFEVGQIIIDFDTSIPFGASGSIDLRGNGTMLDDQVDAEASYHSLISKGFTVYIEG